VGRRLVIWGAAGHARVVADIVRLEGRFDLAGFLDDLDPSRRGTTFAGLTVLGGREVLGPLRGSGVDAMILAFGDCPARLRLGPVARSAGFELVTAIHPRAVVAGDALVGPGTVVAAGAVVNPGTRLGDSVIVNTAASVDHDCRVEDGAHVAPGARLGGHVTVGRGAWVGIGAIVKDHLTVGAGSQVGAGAVVLADVPAGVVAYGAPARVVRRVGEPGPASGAGNRAEEGC
jgi:UDP-N-acetylbacillosamine N-acetyltransferase